MLFSLNTGKKKSWWCALLIIANIWFCSTSEYKGECPSYFVEVRCDHVISVGQCKVNKSKKKSKKKKYIHPFWVKAFISNSWGLTLQFPHSFQNYPRSQEFRGSPDSPWSLSCCDKQSFPYWTCHRRKKETFVV